MFSYITTFESIYFENLSLHTLPLYVANISFQKQKQKKKKKKKQKKKKERKKKKKAEDVIVSIVLQKNKQKF